MGMKRRRTGRMRNGRIWEFRRQGREGISRGDICACHLHIFYFSTRRPHATFLPILLLPPASRYFISFCLSSLLQPLLVFSVWSNFITHFNASIRTSPYHFIFIPPLPLPISPLSFSLKILQLVRKLNPEKPREK